jgi:DNA polymerase IV
MEPTPEYGFRRVMHADLDSFFAAVEELDDPTLRGQPVIVGGDPDGRGVVSTANYIARRYGIHSAMSAALAKRLCPQAIFLRPRFERYKTLSRQVMAILDEYFEVREQVSIDEAYGELPPGVPGCRKAEDIAREIKRRVHEETGLVISVGVARNKSIAKLASDVSKPDGCVIVRPGGEAAFLRPLPVGRLSGVGPHTRERMERLGYITVGELADADPDLLGQHFGKHGLHLWLLANGHDNRPVVSDHGPPKSISAERTYERDVADLERAAAHVRELAERVAQRAAREEVAGGTVVLKVKWPDFRIITRQRPLDHATNDASAITEAALALLADEVAPLVEGGAAIRLLGVGLHGIIAPAGSAPLEGYYQPPLFDEETLAQVG